MRLVWRAALVLALVFGLTAIGNDAHAANERRAARKIVHFTNVTRLEHGLHRLDPTRKLNHLAVVHSRDMATKDTLYHRSSLPCFYWGENVGAGTTAFGIFRAFMRSPDHRRNMLGNFRHVGVGAVRRDGVLWVTVELCG